MTGQQVTGARERGRKGLALTIVASVLLIAAGLHLWPLALSHLVPDPAYGPAVATGARTPPSWERRIVTDGAAPGRVAPPAARPGAAVNTGAPVATRSAGGFASGPLLPVGRTRVEPPAVAPRSSGTALVESPGAGNGRQPRTRQPGQPTAGTAPLDGAPTEAALHETASSEGALVDGVSQPPALLAARELVAAQAWAPVVVDATPWASGVPMTPPPAAGALTRAFSAAGQAVAKGFKATGGALRAAF